MEIDSYSLFFFAVNPETRKVRGWRHSLQRLCLSKDKPINPDDMESVQKTLKLVEEYDGITAEVLRLTKIGKVMKRILGLPEIPRNEEFNIRERAEKLCNKWAVSRQRERLWGRLKVFSLLTL
jgi:predicted RND superfamily exporter protein